MNSQECRDEAVRLLKMAEYKVNNHVPHMPLLPEAEQLTNIALVYAALAAVPDVQDWRGEIHERRPDGPGDVFGRIGR